MATASYMNTSNTRQRPSKVEYFLTMAELVATRSTCVRRMVGCVLIDKYKHVIATGYNGTPIGLPHCLDVPCSGSREKSGEKLDECFSVHAEQNALLQCRNVMEIEECYCTTLPCIHCLKMIMNTSCKKIYFIEEYKGIEKAIELCSKVGIELIQIDVTNGVETVITEVFTKQTDDLNDLYERLERR
jgi:dCMP deaminase